MLVSSPLCWIDEYFYSENRIVLTQKELNIPGLKTFGYHNMKAAVSPLAPHYHPNCYEFTIVIDGVLRFYANQQSFDINGGEVFISKPNEVHSTNEIPMSKGKIYWFQIDVSNPEDFLYLSYKAAQHIIYELSKISCHKICIKNTNPAYLFSHILRMSNNPSQSFHLSNCITNILYEILDSSQVIDTTLSHDILSSLKYIDESILNTISLDELANNSYLSLSQFKQKFKKELGISPRSYINLKKIEFSKHLLQQGSMSITDIATLLGFSTSAYFTVVFKKYTAMTPSEYILNLK